MSNLSPNLRQRFFDQNGAPLVGGKLYSYQAGTNTPLSTFTDSTELTSNTNPIILDANGECNLWINNNSYKFVLKDASDVVQWTVDNVQALVSISAPTGVTGLSGDVTGSGTGTITTTLTANAVTNSKLATMANNTIKGNVSGGTASPSDLTATQTTAMLSAFVGDSGSGGTKGLVPAPVTGDATKYLKGDGTWATAGTTSPLTTKGDLYAYSSANARLPVGSDGQVLTADSAQTLGVKWATGSGGITALTTDVVASGTGSVAATIQPSAVTNSKMANMANNTIKGNVSGSSAAPSDLTATQTTAMLNAMVGDSGSGGTKGLVPAPASGDAAASKFLKADGTWATAGGGSVTTVSVVSANGLAGTVANATTTPAITLTTSVTGLLKGNGTAISVASSSDLPTIALTGNVTGSASGGSIATTIAASAVTLAMHANLAATTIMGNNTGSAAAPLALTPAQVNAMLPVVTSTLNGLAPFSGGGTTNFLRADGTWAVPAGGTTSPLTTKGDLYTFSTANARLGVGTNGQALISDSTQSTGIRWNYPCASSIAMQWQEDDSSPTSIVENNVRVYSYANAISQNLYCTIKVPYGYLGGSQINLRVPIYSPDSTGTVLMQAVATLFRAGFGDAMTSTTNQRTTTNSAFTLSGLSVNFHQALVLDISSSTGTINGASITAGDLIQVRLYRGTDTATSDVRVIAYAAEATFS